MLVTEVIPDHQERMVSEETLVILVNKDLQGSLEELDQLGHLEPEVLQETEAIRVMLEHLEHQADKVLLALLVLVDQLVQVDLLVHKDRRDQKDNKALQVKQDPLGLLEKVAQLVSQDHQDLLAQLENKVWQDHLVQKEIEVKLARQEIVVTLVMLGQQDLLDNLGLLVNQVPVVQLVRQDLQDPLDQQGMLEIKDKKVKVAVGEKVVSRAYQALMGNLVQKAPRESKDQLDQLDHQAHLD